MRYNWPEKCWKTLSFTLEGNQPCFRQVFTHSLTLTMVTKRNLTITKSPELLLLSWSFVWEEEKEEEEEEEHKGGRVCQVFAPPSNRHKLVLTKCRQYFPSQTGIRLRLRVRVPVPHSLTNPHSTPTHNPPSGCGATEGSLEKSP